MMEIRQGANVKDYKHYDTERLREEFLITQVFKENSATYVYSNIDRIIIGGAYPIDKEVELESGSALRANYFLERREIGIINIAGDGQIIVDDEIYDLKKYDCVYIGRGARKVIFKSLDKTNPAKFYFNSCPAHKHYPTKLIDLEHAVKADLGSKAECNERTINKYIVPDTVETCQLMMGLTILKEGSVWNTMPTHTHDRRMEVYLYFDIKPQNIVIHFMGTEDETRHIIVNNEQAVISPSFSIHSGVGTANYTFIWGMCGENQDFSDMDAIDTEDLK